MAILKTASVDELSRLLALFPVAHVRSVWSEMDAPTKKELCDVIAAQASQGQIATFVAAAFGYCKQHVYLFSLGGSSQADLPASIMDGGRIKRDQSGALYITRSVTDVVQLDPYEDASISFLWPLRTDIIEGHVAVRFVVLEKDIASYFPRQTLTRSHGITEEAIVADIVTEMSLSGVDLHRGMKRLWKSEYMDCYSTKYRKPKSSATETVDRGEKKGIRENDPELFKILMGSLMRTSLFVIEDPDVGINKVSIDPSLGRLSFLQYSSKPGAVEDVVRKLLQKN